MFETPVLAPLATEIFLLIMACVVLVADLFVKDKQHTLTYALSLATMVAAFMSHWASLALNHLWPTLAPL